MIRHRQISIKSDDEEADPEENHEHKTLDYLEYEDNRQIKTDGNRQRIQNIKDKDEINNLESWFKKNVKIKKQFNQKKTQNIVQNYLDTNQYKILSNTKVKTSNKGPQEINIQLIQDITQRKIYKERSCEAKQVFRSTIQNFKTLKSMFDKHNMRNFEPTQEQAVLYEKKSLNTDYLNNLNDFNKQQLRKHVSAIKDQFLVSIINIDDDILKIKEVLETNIEKTLMIQTQIKQNQQKIQQTNQQCYNLDRQLKIHQSSNREEDKNETQLKQQLAEKTFILDQYKNMILECKANLIANNQIIQENQENVKKLKMEKLNIQLILKDIILQDYNNQTKHKESFSSVINSIWKINQQLHESMFPIILDQKSQLYLINVAKLQIQIQQNNIKKKNLQKQLEIETRKKIQNNVCGYDKTKQIQAELKKIKNVTTSKDINNDKIQINRQNSQRQFKPNPHQQFQDDFYYQQTNDQNIQQMLKQQIEKQNLEDFQLEEQYQSMKQEEKNRIYQSFNCNNQNLSEKVKKDILTYLFGYKEVDSILQLFHQMKQQGI